MVGILFMGYAVVSHCYYWSFGGKMKCLDQYPFPSYYLVREIGLSQPKPLHDEKGKLTWSCHIVVLRHVVRVQ